MPIHLTIAYLYLLHYQSCCCSIPQNISNCVLARSGDNFEISHEQFKFEQLNAKQGDSRWGRIL